MEEIEPQLHRLNTVLNYCDKNNRELQTVNLMAQRNVPVTFVQDVPAPNLASTAGSNPGEAVGADAKTKPESTVRGGSSASPQSKSASSANGSKLQEKKTQPKREHAKLKPFKEGRSSGPPPAAAGADGRQSAPPVRRALPVETTRLNG
jgi:hypothetical protein